LSARKGAHLFLNVRFSKNVQQARESLRPLTVLTYNIPNNTLDQWPAGNFLDSLPSLRNNDPERFAEVRLRNQIAESHEAMILAEAQTVVAPCKARENVFLSREVNRMSCGKLQLVITVVFLLSSLLMPPGYLGG
jgi:hypothetical protein